MTLEELCDHYNKTKPPATFVIRDGMLCRKSVKYTRYCRHGTILKRCEACRPDADACPCGWWEERLYNHPRSDGTPLRCRFCCKHGDVNVATRRCTRTENHPEAQTYYDLPLLWRSISEDEALCRACWNDAGLLPNA